jgi:hypothetical protein
MSYYASTTYGRPDIHIKLFITTIPLPGEVDHNRGKQVSVQWVLRGSAPESQRPFGGHVSCDFTLVLNLFQN